MAGPRAPRLVEVALRCYPARWQRRHGDEAAELAVLLIGDGTPAGSIAWNYLIGAAREWLTPPPGRRLSTVACALLAAACSLGVSAGLLASAGPATAASTSHPHGHAHGQAHGQAHQHGHCPPGTPGPLPAAITAQGQPQVFIGEAGHERSC